MFCSKRFHEPVGDWGRLHDAMPSTEDLRDHLLSLTRIYTGKAELDGRGLSYYMKTQIKFTDIMIEKWEFLVSQSIHLMKTLLSHISG